MAENPNDYANYVVDVGRPGDPRPHMRASGRIQMFRDAHREVNAKVCFRREFVQLSEDTLLCCAEVESELFGSAQACSRVKLRGGKGADQSNPYETAETRAYARCLGFLGCGVLPSGFATVEEMESVQEEYIMPQGKRGLLTQKLRDLGHTDAKIEQVLAEVTSAEVAEKYIAGAIQQWKARAKAAEAAFAAPGGAEPDAAPDPEPPAPPQAEAASADHWDPIYAAFVRAGGTEEELDWYLKTSYDAKRRGITDARSLGQNAVMRFLKLTDTDEKAKELVTVVRRDMAKAKAKS